MSATNPSSNLPLFHRTMEEALRHAPPPIITSVTIIGSPSQLAGGNEQAASGLPVAALLALQAALWQTRGTEFCSDQVWRNLSPTMREIVGTHGNAIGWLMSRAAKLKQITRTGRTVPSIRPKSRGRQVAVWRWL